MTKQRRRRVSIGDVLAAQRRQAGLSITQVSQRTCIRETIIRGIERGDYSACGGDFYTRGHIRSIARAVGAEPDALVREYDLAHGAPRAVAAAEVFEPSTAIKLNERRRPNWSAAMALALTLIVGFAVYQAWHSSGVSRVAAQGAGRTVTKHDRKPPQPSPRADPSPAASHAVVIHLTAVEDCWVQLTTASGRVIFSGIVDSGTAERWTEHQAVSLVLGNPGGVALTVNGRNLGSPGQSGQPVTLSFGPGQQARLSQQAG
jgi:cytoskeletal protein RodZ